MTIIDMEYLLIKIIAYLDYNYMVEGNFVVCLSFKTVGLTFHKDSHEQYFYLDLDLDLDLDSTMLSQHCFFLSYKLPPQE